MFGEKEATEKTVYSPTSGMTLKVDFKSLI
jgi:hypothetical protein